MSEALIPNAVPNVVIGVLAFDNQFLGDGQGDIPTVEIENGSVKGRFVINGEAAPRRAPLLFERGCSSVDFIKFQI